MAGLGSNDSSWPGPYLAIRPVRAGSVSGHTLYCRHKGKKGGGKGKPAKGLFMSEECFNTLTVGQSAIVGGSPCLLAPPPPPPPPSAGSSAEAAPESVGREGEVQAEEELRDYRDLDDTEKPGTPETPEIIIGITPELPPMSDPARILHVQALKDWLRSNLSCSEFESLFTLLCILALILGL